MLKWFSGEDGAPGSGEAGSPLRVSGAVGEEAVEEISERLSQTEQLVSQLKEMIREKDAALRAKDDQLKAEKDSCETKLSKLRLQNKAKVTSLTSQLEELKKHNGGVDSPSHSKKGSDSGDQANRGKIVLLKKKLEELEHQLTQRDQELSVKNKELESQCVRGEEMDLMLTEKDKKLSEKEAYIIHLQTAMTGGPPQTHTMQTGESGALQDLQMLVQNLTKKIGEAEERYSLLQEQTDSLRELLSSEREQYSQKENMYKQNIQTFKDIILQKDTQLSEMNQMHEQELFKLAAKSDASADLEQLLKALKQKLHEKEEVLLGRTQVIAVLQGEVDTRDEQIKELTERLKRVHVEQKNLESKMEAEKHVMRAQIRDLMEKHHSEVQRLSEEHQIQITLTQEEMRRQPEEMRRQPEEMRRGHTQDNTITATNAETGNVQRIRELEAKAKEKAEEASKSEAKFLKMKAWSKSRIRQLEEELKKSQSGAAPPDLTALRSHITALEEEREDHLWKVEQYEELRAKNEMLEAKLVVYEEQQRTLQADLEQFTKRTASQASESGSADDTHSQVLEWQEMVAEAVSARDRAREEKSALALRVSHLEEEKEALAERQQELEEELAQNRGLSPPRGKRSRHHHRSLQEDFEFDGHAPFQDPVSTLDSSGAEEGENMGDGLRSVVEELELERNQLQEQIVSLEERCQDLEDRLQLQQRIETLQNETEKLQSQLASARSQQSREAEKHQILVNSLNEQLKGLSDTQECLESSLIEKENTLAQTSEKLELISSLRESLQEKEIQFKEISDKLLQTEHNLEEVSKKSINSEKQCSELKMEVSDLTQKLNIIKEKAQKQEATIETLQTELDQTNEDLDKLNTAHLEERSQLIHDLQSCEREIDHLKDTLCEKEKEILTLTSHMTEYAEQITDLKQEIKLKEESLVQVESALSKAERDAMVLRDSQSSDQQVLNLKISEMVEKLNDFEVELTKTKEERDSKRLEVGQLVKQADEDKKIIQELRMDVQKHAVNYRNHLSECETHINSLKEQLLTSNNQLKESEEVISQLNANKGKMQEELQEKGLLQNELKSVKEEQNRLLAEVENYKTEVQTLNVRLKKRTQNEESIRLELQGKLDIIATLEKQVEEEKTKYISELQGRDAENQKISGELKSKTENLSKLKNTMKNLKTENGQLQKKLKSLTDELDVEKGNVKQLDGKMASVTELNTSLEKEMQCLAEEKVKLEELILEHLSSISGLTAEKDDLNAKVTKLNTMYSKSTATIEGLQKDKEELTIRTNDLNKVLEQSTHSNSEILLAKTNECSHLSQLLREKEEESNKLLEKVENLSSKVAQLEQDLVEKDNYVSELRSTLEAFQNQGKQLQEALSQLEERERGLKSEAVKKDGRLKEKQAECKGLLKEVADKEITISKLQLETDKLSEECIKLSKKLGDREEQLQKISMENGQQNEDMNNLVISLRTQLSSTEEEVKRLESEIETGQSKLVELQSALQSALEENRNVHNNVESKNKELARFEEQLKKVTEQLSILSDQNKKLQEELERNIKGVSELSNEKSLLQGTISNMEGQKLNDQKVIDDLTKEKEDITVTITKLNKALKENEMLNSEKTNECSVLLREKDEHVDKLKIEISQLNVSLNEKEYALSEQKNQLLQLEDTVSMLQEQGTVLKSALMEKDTMLNQKIQEAGQIKELMSTMQAEINSLRENGLTIKAETEQKDQKLQALNLELQNHKDELSKRSESVLSLSSQLGAMNDNAAKMETELTNLRATLEKLGSENAHLTQEQEQNKTKMVDFEDNIQLLTEQNGSLKKELLKTVTELSKTKEEMENFKMQVCDRENRISALSNELKVEKETLTLTMQGNDDVLKRQHDLVQQLNNRIHEEEEKRKEKISENVNLIAQVSELEKTVGDLKGQVDSLTSESSQLKTALENKEKASLEYKKSSSAAVKKLNAKLKAKDSECESFKEKISHLEESISKLNSSVQVQVTETENLQKLITEKEAVVSEQLKSIQDLQRKADEALLFKTQFTESTEFVSRLQSERESLQKSKEETQSAFENLQEKYAAQLEEFQKVQNQLSQKIDEVANLNKLLQDRTNEKQDAQSTVETLKSELSKIRDQLEKAKQDNSIIIKEKDEALASHQSNVSKLTVEIERLKLQHCQVVTQMDALTENIEQREMALHAINSQYAAQAQHTSQLVSRIQTLEAQNNSLQAEISLTKDENLKQVTTVSNDNAHLQEKIRKLVKEKNDLEKTQHQIEQSQVELRVLMEQQSNSSGQTLERLMAEKESLQSKVSAKDEEISKLKENIEKLEQILQDSEKEWLLVLDKEKQDRNLIAEQLKCVENEIGCKDVKVIALKEDLDHLQQKLSEAVLAVKHGSEQLMAKEMEAAMCKGQLENVLASLQEKDNVNNSLQQILNAVESELLKLVDRNTTAKDPNDKSAYLLDMIQNLQQSYQRELDVLKNNLNETVAKLKETENIIVDGGKADYEKGQQISMLQKSVNHLQTQLQEVETKCTSLYRDLQAKEEQISCMNVQINQQKELLAGLSQQLKEKDASIAQVMESAANERVRLTEESSLLRERLEVFENEHNILMESSLQSSQQLESDMSQLQSEFDAKNLEMIKKNDEQKSNLAKLAKEKEVMKKKLQAALVVRKDLTKQIENFEKQNEENANVRSQVTLLNDKLQDVENRAQTAEQLCQEKVAALERKEAELGQIKSESDVLVTENQSLKAELSEKETCLVDSLQKLEQLQANLLEKENDFEKEKSNLVLRIEELQNEIKTCREESVSTSAAADLESELAQLKHDKAMMQKKAQAALHARKETMKKAQESEKKLTKELAELKDDYKALLEQQCQQTNELNAVQLSFDEKIKELEELGKISTSYLDELSTLRQLLEEKDNSLQDLKMVVAEKESHSHSLSNELEAVKSKMEGMSLEAAKKDEFMKQLESKLQKIENELIKAQNEVDVQTGDAQKYFERIKELELKCEQEKQLCESKTSQKYQILTEENKVLLDKCNQIKVELETAQQLVSEKSSENVILQKCLDEKQQRLNEDKEDISTKLKQVHQDLAQMESNLEIEKQENMNALELIDKLRDEINSLSEQINETRKQNMELQEQKTELANFPEMLNEKDMVIVNIQGQLSQKSSEVSSLQKCLEETQQRLSEDKEEIARKFVGLHQDLAQMQSNLELEKQEKANALGMVDKLKGEVALLSEQLEESKMQYVHLQEQTANFEVKINEKNNAILEIQAQFSEKQELIEALEHQLEQQTKDHSVAIEKMKTEASEIQKSTDETSKKDDRETKITLLTKKLQAALVSRKELQKDNGALKEELEKLSAKFEAKDAEFGVAESSILNLKQEKSDLESSVVTLGKEKDDLKAEVNTVLNNNRSLSAACESLKQTIENITQQKQAFSCQLESLKDSQTDELSKWKSKHSELKQEYESLLQAYENVSSEMDKMRQLLEAAKKERQEAIWKVNKYEAEIENLQKQVQQMEMANEKLKENLQAISQDKELSVEKQENAKIEHLEIEIERLAKTVEDLRKQLSAMEAEKENLIEALKNANCSLENKQLESKLYTDTMQGKFNEALSLNNSLMVQIEAQKTELGAQLEINQLLQKEKQKLTEEIDKIQNEQEIQLGKKDEAIGALNEILTQHSQETISLNEKVRILEDDKSLLQEELENTQEISDKVKNENEYLETVILKNSEKIDELTESVSTLQSQNSQLSTQLTTSKELSDKIIKEKEEEQLKLVKVFEEKLKTVQRGNEGSKNVKKELQELLKEKHQEINLLQQNCITCQEVILDLESSLKISQSACEHSEKELKQYINKLSVLEERNKQLESELATSEGLLDEANKRILSIQSERDQMAFKLPQQSLKTEEEKISDKTEEAYSFVENQVLHQQIKDLKVISKMENQKVMELQQQIDSQNLQITTLKRAAETNKVKLTALTTSSPDGGDTVKTWNDLYQKALHEKDNQLLEQGYVIKRFLEDMRMKEKEVSELRLAKSRLERTLNDYSVAAAAHQRQLFVMSASNAELNENVEVLSEHVKELSAQVERDEQDKNTLNRQLVDKEDVLLQVQLKLQQVEKLYADSDAQLNQLQVQSDKIQAEYEKQEGISLQLKTILQSKNSEISSLLSCKDGQMSGYLEQLQANYRSQISVYEDRLTSVRYQREKSTKELRSLESKVKSLQIQVNKAVQEKDHMASKMESFKNSLVSLQSERERIMSEYRILEAKNQLVLKAKGEDKGEGGATKGLKHEIRKLLHQMDDLNSENAMLRAQLVRYREDLNQVLSLKDNQLKVLLKKQQDTIKVLENDKMAAEKQNREIRLELQKEEETSSTLKSEISKLKAQITKLEMDKNEMVTTSEQRVIADLQNAIAAKAGECNDLQQKLLFEKNQNNELKNKMQQLENETDTKLSEAEVKYNSELDNFEREVNLMRNERETADQRVADLAKDLLELEQQLSEAKTQSEDAKSQNESLCKAMAALQNDRDQLIEDFKILRNRYDEELRESQAALTKMERKFQDATSDLTIFGKQRDVVLHKLKALESKDAQNELTKLVDELGKALSEKEGELKHVKLENETYSRQLSAFSRSMASLQNDRDRLMVELAGAKREFEHKQGSSGSVDKSKNSASQLANEELESGQKLNDVEKEVAISQESAVLRSSQEKTDMQPPTGVLEETVAQLQQERVRLHQDLQRCLFEIQRRDQYIQQLNNKLQQTVEENSSLSAQLRSVSQSLQESQDHCHQLQNQAQGSVFEVAPGAPQERSSDSVNVELTEITQLRERLLELEQSFTEERSRREAVEEALRITEDRVRSENQRDFSIEMEADDEWEALSLNPNQPLITRKVRGGVAACRQWLRGRSLYFSRLLTTRARSRYFFLAYLLTLHVLVLMCLTGAL